MMLLDIISKLISTVTGLITLAEHLSKARTQDTAKKEGKRKIIRRIVLP